MAHKHTHEHSHHHPEPSDEMIREGERFDAASKSLSDALRISFVILKVIMIVLVVAFIASGFKTIGSDERALVLRFGEIRGVAEERVRGSGLAWAWPYPIGEIVKIPVEEQIDLSVDSFWYRESLQDITGEGPRSRRIPEKLDPLLDGYCLTRSQTRASGLVAELAGQVAPTQLNDGSDYNIVHTRWEIVYQVDSVEEFFTNVYIPDVKPGERYVDVMVQTVTPMLRNIVEDAVVTAMVRYTIDEALQSTDTIRLHVRDLVQRKLDAIESGIRVTSVQLVDVEWPKQVNLAFEEFIAARQTIGQAISEAGQYADNTLAEAAGRVAEPLYEFLMAENPDESQLELLWSQVAGQAQDAIAQARAYRTRVVENASANANYLASILPEFRKSPELVTQRLYLDALEQVFENAEEKFILQPSDEVESREIRIMVNRAPLSNKGQSSN